MLKVTTVCLALVTAAAIQEANVAGTWILLLEGHQVGLAIEQSGSTLEGTLQIMGQNVPVVGALVDDRLTLTADADVATHGGEPGPQLKILGRVKDDGTLEGEMITRRGAMKWTAERLKRPN